MPTKLLYTFLLFLPLYGTYARDLQVIERDEFTDEVIEMSKQGCQRHEYFNEEDFQCNLCTTCATYLYEKASCMEYSDTVCGWCGSKNAVINDDFKAKCFSNTKPFIERRFDSEAFQQMSSMEMDEALEDGVDVEAEDDYQEDSKDESDPASSESRQELVISEVKQYLRKRGSEAKNNNMRVVVDNDGDENVDYAAEEFKVRNERTRQFPKLVDVGDDSRTELEAELEKTPELEPMNDAEILSEPEIPKTRFLGRRWDRWIDDKIKRLDSSDSSSSDDEKEVRSAEELAQQDTIIVIADVNESEETDLDEDAVTVKEVNMVRIVARCCLLMCFIVAMLSLCRRKKNKHTRRTIVLNPADYKIMQSCGARAAAANLTDKNYHENPLCV